MESPLFDTNAQESEVPPEPLSFLLGRDHEGHWIVQETHDLCGGVFANENAATRYAKFESAGRRGSTIRLIPEPIELNCSSGQRPRRAA
jgi:hypothetical protein